MRTIIVVTNFSASSRNALDYTCSFFGNTGLRILLLHIFNFPAALTSDAISVAAMSETIANDKRLLEREYDWAKENYTDANIEMEITAGNFMNELRERTDDEDVAFVVLGAGGKYNDLLSWDANIIDAFVDLQLPVLVIPSQVKYHPVTKVAFACNYYRKDLQMPASLIRKLVQFTNAKLYIIHIVNPSEIVDEAGLNNKHFLQQSFADLDPVYYEPSLNKIIMAIDNFIAEEKIDMLIVIPGRQGIWHGIFEEQHTKGLVHLNQVPIVSLHRERNFI